MGTARTGEAEAARPGGAVSKAAVAVSAVVTTRAAGGGGGCLPDSTARPQAHHRAQRDADRTRRVRWP